MLRVPTPQEPLEPPAAGARGDMQAGMIGRATELAAVERLLDRSVGRFAALVIEGEPGIGKTTLLAAASEAATRRGFEVLSAGPAPSEASLPLSGYGDLFERLVPTATGLLPAPQSRAIEVALLLREPLGHPADQRTLAVATTTLLRVLSRDRPLLVAIDDVQWLDDSSARLLAYAARRLTNARVGLVTTWRGAVPGTDPLGLGAWVEQERSERVAVGPMSVAALHALLQERTGQSFSRYATIRIHDQSAGNPFYALEIARAVLQAGEPLAPGLPLPIPDTLAALTTGRIRMLPRATRVALQATAVALEPPTLATLARIGIANPRRSLEPAIRDGMLTVDHERVRFAHPLLASAVLADTPPERLRELHLALSVAAGSAEARAQHRARSSDGPDAEAADALDAAATRSRLRGAPIAAGELLEAARAITPPEQPTTAADRAHRSAQCYFEGGATRRAALLLETLIENAPAGPVRARSLQLLGQVRARSLSLEDAQSLAVRALDEAGGDAPTATGIELDIAFYAFCLGDLPTALTHASAALEHAEVAGLDGPRADALACLAMAEFWLGRGVVETRMSEALAGEDRSRTGPLEMRPHFVDALLHLWTGDLDGAHARLTALRDELVERGEDTALPFLSLFLVVGALWRGDLATAGSAADAAWDIASLNGEPVAMALALSERALAHAICGPPEDAREAAIRALELFRNSQWNLYLTWPLWALGMVELSLGDAAGVDAWLGPLADGIVAMDGADPVLGIVLPDEIEALVAIGGTARAERYLAWLEDGGRRLDRTWALAAAARCRGILAAARGDLDAAVAALDAAVPGQAGMPFELARTLLVKGQVHRRRKEKRLAADALEAAIDRFDRVGAPVWSERARRELIRVGRRPSAPTALTATEQQVAELAARGLTNRQVAERAFLSPKTVDNVLGRVYRKLAIGSRAQLGAVMATGGHAERDLVAGRSGGSGADAQAGSGGR
jgi:DNA-binding CsgD family transcriptional regulator